MAFDTATILDSLKALVDDLVPAVQFRDDDRFRATIGAQFAVTGPRQVLLSATAGIRKPTGGQTCNQWETTVAILIVYPDTPGEPGERATYSRAVQDTEDMLAAIYSWSVTTPGIVNIEPQIGTVDPDGGGFLLSEREIFIEFERS